jgi:hypothetical protein
MIMLDPQSQQKQKPNTNYDDLFRQNSADLGNIGNQTDIGSIASNHILNINATSNNYTGSKNIQSIELLPYHGI